MYDKAPYFYGTGRRKSSVARVRIYQGTGKVTINDRDIDDYFGLDTLKTIVRQPLVLTGTEEIRSQSSSSRSAVLQEIIICKDFSRGTQKRIFQTFPRRQSIRSYASPAGFCFKTSITPASHKTERG